MTSYVLIPLFAAFINLGLALFVFTRDPRLRINQVFMMWGASLAIWNAGAFMMFRVTDHDGALLWARILHFGVIFIPVSILHLTTLLSHRRARRFLIPAYAFTFCLAVSNFTDLFIRDVRPVTYAWFAVAGPGFWVFSAIFPLMAVPALYMLWRARSEASPIKAKKFTTLLWANGMLLVLGSNDMLPVMGFDRYPLTHIQVYPWGQFGACIYGVLVAFSVLHDQLLDVRVSIGRQAATFLRLGFLVATAYLLLAVVAVLVRGAFTAVSFTATLAVVIVSAGIAGIAFPRLLGGDSELLERHILGDRFEYQQQMREFIHSIRGFTDIGQLVDETIRNLHTVMRLETASIVVLNARTKEKRYAVAWPEALAAHIEGLTAESPVFEHFRATKARLLDLRNESDAIWAGKIQKDARADLTLLKPEYVFPLATSGSPDGIIVFGHKVGDSPYTSIDVEICSELAEQLSFALERIHLSEAGALNERLDTMSVMSRGLAHDMNNLITPVSIFLQVTQKNYSASPIGDLHKVALRNIETINSYVREAIFFSENHGTNLTPVDPAALLSAVSELCQQRAERNRCTIATECSAERVFLGDKILLQRMLANLVNNAIDASPMDSRVLLQAMRLPGTKVRGAWMRFHVVDAGSGIPPENLKKVWEPYWTTKSEGDVPRGFGLGLTVVQKIVLLHKGSVSIESAMGSGTAVQVDIPCDPEEAAAS